MPKTRDSIGVKGTRIANVCLNPVVHRAWIYVEKMGSPQLAEAYCDRVYDKVLRERVAASAPGSRGLESFLPGHADPGRLRHLPQARPGSISTTKYSPVMSSVMTETMLKASC